jgi:hypothetical protein
MRFAAQKPAGRRKSMSEEKMETMNGYTAAWDKLARMMENK